MGSPRSQLPRAKARTKAKNRDMLAFSSDLTGICKPSGAGGIRNERVDLSKNSDLQGEELFSALERWGIRFFAFRDMTAIVRLLKLTSGGGQGLIGVIP